MKHPSIWLACITAVVVLAIGLLPACSGTDDNEGKIGIVVSILPQAEFAERVGGNKVDITVMVEEGADPHTFSPKPSQMQALTDARMYAKVGSGIEFETKWMDTLIERNSDMPVVDCSQGITLIEMTAPHEHEVEEPDDEEFGHDGQDHHGDLDPHIWMSPRNAMTMVANICDGLTQVDPKNTSYYQFNRDAYLTELEQLDREIREGLSGVSSRLFMVYHPSFGYFAAEYDLTMMAVEEDGKEPTAAGISHLIAQAKEHDVKVVFTSPQFNPRSAEVIADEIAGRVVSIDPLERDYISNLHTMLNELVLALE